MDKAYQGAYQNGNNLSIYEAIDLYNNISNRYNQMIYVFDNCVLKEYNKYPNVYNNVYTDFPKYLEDNKNYLGNSSDYLAKLGKFIEDEAQKQGIDLSKTNYYN